MVYYCDFWEIHSAFPGIYLSITSPEIYLPLSKLWQTLQDCEFLFLINHDMDYPFTATRFYFKNYFRFLQGNEFTGSVIFLANLPLSDLYVFSRNLKHSPNLLFLFLYSLCSLSGILKITTSVVLFQKSFNIYTTCGKLRVIHVLSSVLLQIKSIDVSYSASSSLF